MKFLFTIFFFGLGISSSYAQEKNLDFFVTTALSNSPLLKYYQNQVASLALDSQLLRASLRPMVNGVSNNSYAPVINGYGYDAAITNGQQVSGMVSVSKAFVSSKNIAAQVAGFGIQAQAVANNKHVSEQDLKKAITDQYIAAYGDLLQLNFNKEVNDLLTTEDSLLKKLTQQNVFKQSDYLAFVVTLQQQLLNTSQLEVQYNLDLATLNYFAGIVDTTTVLLQDPRLELKLSVDYTNSFFYKQFTLDSLKLHNDKGADSVYV